MTRIGTLWGYIRQPQTKVILSVAALNEFEIDQREWSHTNRPQEFMSKFTYGKVPAFEGTDGFKLTEGSTIAHYLCSIGTKVNLLGSSAQETAIINQWAHFAEHEIAVPAGISMGAIYGMFGDSYPQILDKNYEQLIRAFDYLESHLASRSSGFVALDTLTLADLVLAGAVYVAAGASLGCKEREQYPHVFGHYDKVAADAKLKAYWGRESFVDVRITELKPVPTS